MLGSCSVIQCFHIATIKFHWAYLHLFTAPQKYDFFPINIFRINFDENWLERNL